MSDVNTWNAGFNEIAASCGFSAEDILELDDGDLVGDTCWFRLGDKVQVCRGNAVFTVNVADLTP
jgi:hypothetical protein